MNRVRMRVARMRMNVDGDEWDVFSS